MTEPKEYSREWFLAQSAAASRVVANWPDSMKKNLVMASANLPVMVPTRATVVETPPTTVRVTPAPESDQG